MAVFGPMCELPDEAKTDPELFMAKRFGHEAISEFYQEHLAKLILSITTGDLHAELSKEFRSEQPEGQMAVFATWLRIQPKAQRHAEADLRATKRYIDSMHCDIYAPHTIKAVETE